MAERPAGAIDWLRGLFGGKRNEPPRWSGEEGLTTGRRAVVAVEVMACDALCRAVDEAGPTDRAVLNTFERPVGVTLAGGARGVVGPTGAARRPVTRRGSGT